MKRRNFSFLLLPLIFAGFVFGIVKLFQLRFEQGDVYPPSSSLRSDPLGAKIFYDSLRELNSVTAKRLYDPLPNASSGRGKTLFLLGLQTSDLIWVPKRDVKEIEDFARSGGRIVISFQPMNSKGWNTRRDEKRKEQEKEDRKTKKKSSLHEEDLKIISLFEKWNLKLDYEDLELDEKGVAVPANVTRDPNAGSLPEILPWHTALCFQNLSNQWKTIYARDKTNAAMIERDFGKGSIVLSSDSYLFSNEAMRNARQPELLAWFVGPNQSVLFDETHFGIAANPGVAALARKYRLHGFVAGLLLLAGLFVWQNAVSFVPPHDDDIFEGRNAVAAGKESAAGFVNLLRRNIPPSEILSTCFAEWKKSGAHRRQKSFGKMEKVETLVQTETARPKRERNPVQSYREISTLLTEKKSP